jgi:hypothetical protein
MIEFKIELNHFYLDFWTFLYINISLEGTFSIQEIVSLILCIIRISRSSSCTTTTTTTSSSSSSIADIFVGYMAFFCTFIIVLTLQ